METFVSGYGKAIASCYMENASGSHADRPELIRLGVTTCNRNGPDLQSSRFSTGIDCVYPSQQTGIICE
ncbi:Resolvase [Pseudomonas savastanoi pv. phaseolicola]|nr:Resolvase [Pseudomonas savastanoi pv. phaseolicola]